MVSKTLSSLLILACVLVLPIVAQTPPAPAANQTMGTNPAATTTRVRRPVATSGAGYAEAARLATLLQDTQGNATLGIEVWKRVAHEANSLSVKLNAAHKSWQHDASEARVHVRELVAAVEKSDADGAKKHAGLALPYVYKIVDATAPKK
ncbi:MAG TPA: hypothetical protein VG323_21705 [Thermoanaerobaculia bacterium]|nr:hypothetical protein [Thermoanaerobaculia bacterium]